MKKMKYLLALCLILAAASAFAACGNNSNVADTSMVENTQRGGSVADDAGKAGKDIIDGAGNAGKDVIDGAGDAGKDVIDGAGDAGKDVIDGAGDAGKDVIDGAKDAIDDAGNAIKRVLMVETTTNSYL